MALPDVTLAVADGALGITGDTGHPLAFIGTASAGPVGVVTPVGGVTPLKNLFKSGPLVELAGNTLDGSGGPHYAVRVSASNAGTNGTITRSGTGIDPGVGLTGTPLDDYEGQVRIVKAGAVGTATFQVSFDGGDTWSEEYLTAATVATWATETGLTLTFAVGAYVTGDLYSWASVGPTYSASDLASALDALHASGYEFEGVFVAGTVGGANDTAKVTAWVALATAVASKMASWFGQHRYAFAALAVPNVADSALAVSAVANFVSDRVVGVVGDVEIVSPVTDRIQRRNLIWALAQRVALIDFQRSVAAVRDGTLKGVTKLYRDERITPGLDDLRFVTARSFDNAVAGYYISQGRTFAGAGSDFGTIERRRVMDRACKMARRAFLPYLEEDLEVNENSAIEERQAVAIETDVNGQLSQDLVATRRLSEVQTHISRTDNLISSETLNVEVRGRPRPKAKWIKINIGFSNPALGT